FELRAPATSMTITIDESSGMKRTRSTPLPAWADRGGHAQSAAATRAAAAADRSMRPPDHCMLARAGMPGNTHLYIALSGFVPAVLAMWIVDRLDAKRPEPASLRRKVALFGALSCLPAIILEMFVGAIGNGQGIPQITYPGAAFESFVVAAMIEEACKISVVYHVVWRDPHFDERMDG